MELPATKQELFDYLTYFDAPVESDFFDSDVQDKLKKIKVKLDTTKQVLLSLVNRPELSGQIDKDILSGRIYSPGEARNADLLFRALEDYDGIRIEIGETLVSKTGQRLIMSDGLRNKLGFFTDGFLEPKDLDDLLSALQAESIPGPVIDKVTTAMHKYGAILVQRGVFSSLKEFLEDAVGHQIKLVSGAAKADSSTPISPSKEEFGPAAAAPAPVPSTNLPNGFVEYLRNNDKEYDVIAHDIAQDDKFMELFENLKKHYPYYQKLPVEKMVQEIMVHPPLWMKLSPQNKARLQTLVERHRQDFEQKTDEISKNAQADMLQQIKKELGK